MHLEFITHQTIEIVRQTGGFIKAEAAKFDRSQTEYKAANNLVSYVDKQAEEMLVAGLRQIFPQAGFITEEGTAGQEQNPEDLYWIIDPLDGTANFIHGLPVYCVSVGLVKNKIPIAGVIYHLGTDELFFGWQGGGAWILSLKYTLGGLPLDATFLQNATRLEVSTAKTLNDSLLATGFPYYKFEKQDKYLKILETLMQSCHGLRRMGAAAIDLAYVAAGRFEAFYEYNLNSWDMAAGTLLILEAGGQITDFSGGQDWLFEGDVIAGCAAQKELLEVIQRHWTIE
ncbi:MAG: inositol monophosphatase family protein [Spirosomataceae bacterium]